MNGRTAKVNTRDSRGFSPRRADVEDIANTLLRKRDSRPFRLVNNMRSKYGIQDYDFYNFDKTGFMIGMIRPGIVVTRSDYISKLKSI
ncbi:transposase [Colletotrichum chrysophilum]|uniref:Transposase n=1 Tax=Colletotrichum chrysophilum TaxID=1836956 RepID=A0AAD8ZXH1_9PEZI|nr:transposase [Colletotrichum chrysophilum]